MPTFLQPYLLLIKLAMVAALCAGSFYAGHAWRDRAAKQDQLDAALAYAGEIVATRDQEQAWQIKYNQGVNDARTREKQLAADAADARAAVVGLRRTVADLKAGLPEAPAEACRDTAAALAAVLSECTDRYQRVAEAADGHASDAALCIAAWPGD